MTPKACGAYYKEYGISTANNGAITTQAKAIWDASKCEVKVSRAG
jgi:hypothetical protein